MRKTLVLGASIKPERASHQAVRRLQNKGHDVLAVGRGSGQINTTFIEKNWPQDIDIHTVTIYLSGDNQHPYEELILNSGAERVIFNPGAENASLLMRLKQQGIEALNACTLVMLAIDDY